ncbi:hypothetical protein DRP53_07885 [candidate division WOR-3 bacterium]|uniref:Glycosyltransferase RgtA/B/C/D-like domain-containing protein n=1 Tax=candidate division WOR-3 bacterium TaxID=2052148 RepID=A0A660SFE0_UNCW3|nr:MAG: hypothetical protein DRP53_07885 [candidate division WOR-3 bacterium]
MKWILLAIFLILTMVRVINLGCDLPVARTEILQNIGEFYYDEGWWSLGVRDLLYYGDPNHSHFNTIPLTPISSLSYLIFFKVFGLNLYSLRLIGVVASLLAIYLLLRIIKREDNRTVVLSVAIFGFNSIFVLYSRTGMLEVIALPLLLGAMLSYLRGRYLLAGILIGFSVLTKIHTVFLLFAFLFLPKRERIVIGFLIPTIPWLILLIHQPILVHYRSSRWLTQGNMIVNLAKSLFIGLIYRDTLFRNNPLFFIFSLLALPGLWRMKGMIPRLFFLWAISGLLFFGIFPFQPARYLILLLPPLSYAVVKSRRWENRLFMTVIAVLIISQTLFGVVRPIIDNYHGEMPIFSGEEQYRLVEELPRFLKTFDLSRYPEFFARLILYVSASITAILLALPLGILKWRWFRPHRLAPPFIIMIDLVLNLWFLSPSYSFLRFGQRLPLDIDDRVGPAGTFSLLNRLEYENRPVLKRDICNPSLYPQYALLITYHPLMGRFESDKFHKKFRPIIIYSLFNDRYEVTLYEKIENPPYRAGEHLGD